MNSKKALVGANKHHPNVAWSYLERETGSINQVPMNWAVKGMKQRQYLGTVFRRRWFHSEAPNRDRDTQTLRLGLLPIPARWSQHAT
jgi:hypothetical protein